MQGRMRPEERATGSAAQTPTRTADRPAPSASADGVADGCGGTAPPAAEQGGAEGIGALFGFKRELVHIIANVSYGCFEVQEQVREVTVGCSMGYGTRYGTRGVLIIR